MEANSNNSLMAEVITVVVVVVVKGVMVPIIHRVGKVEDIIR